MSRQENDLSEILFGSSSGSSETIIPAIYHAAPPSTLGAEVAAAILEDMPDRLSSGLQRAIQSLTTLLPGERKERQPWDSHDEYRLGNWVSPLNETPGLIRRLENMGVQLGVEFGDHWDETTRDRLDDIWVRTARTLAIERLVEDMPADPLVLKKIAPPQTTLILSLGHASVKPFSQWLDVELPCEINQRRPLVWRYQRNLFAAPRGLETFVPPRLPPMVGYAFPYVAAERVIIAGVVDEDNALQVVGVKSCVSTPRLTHDIEDNVVRSTRSSQEHVLDFRGTTLDDVWAAFATPSPDLTAQWSLADWTCQLVEYVDTFDPVYVPAIRAHRQMSMQHEIIIIN